MGHMPAYNVRITGRVQGVGFRAYVMRLAREYHLLGEVWNTGNGEVRAVLSSDNAGDLDRAIQLLPKGPGQVEKVESNPMTVAPQYDGFSVSSTKRD